MSIDVEMDFILSLIEKARLRVHHQRSLLRMIPPHARHTEAMIVGTALLRSYELRVDHLCKQYHQLKLSDSDQHGMRDDEGRLKPRRHAAPQARTGDRFSA